MPYYPPKIHERLSAPINVGTAAGANAAGTAASFLCGSFARVSLRIEKDGMWIREAKFLSNGCGYMIAAADFLAGRVTGKRLTELHGLADRIYRINHGSEPGGVPETRRQCAEIVEEALRNALSNYRSSVIDEFKGDKALICTCFGISEEAIENCIAENSIRSVGEVTDLCRAGGGCGSCQMMIQEMIDVSEMSKG